MSSAILYVGIVAIWAFVLIPRWLRRPHLLGGETAEFEGLADANTGADEPQSAPTEFEETAAGLSHEPARDRQFSRRAMAGPLSRSRVLQARRRLLTMLLTLVAAIGVCTYLKLTSWWACIPPAGMLGIYLLLLREAALADAEQARWRAAEGLQVQAARQVAPAAETAEVIDISGRLTDELYDQYADATMRAVGD